MHAHLPGNESVHHVPVFQLHLEGCIGQVFNNLALHFNVIFLCHGRLLDHRTTFEVCFLQKAFILVGHDVGLNLGHEVHRDNHDDQQRRSTEIERHVPL